MKKIALLGLSLLFTLGSLAQETKTTKEAKKATTEKAEKSKKEASVGIRRNRTETSESEIYSVISLNADLCIRIYKKIPWNQSLGSIFHVVHR